MGSNSFIFIFALHVLLSESHLLMDGKNSLAAGANSSPFKDRNN